MVLTLTKLLTFESHFHKYGVSLVTFLWRWQVLFDPFLDEDIKTLTPVR